MSLGKFPRKRFWVNVVDHGFPRAGEMNCPTFFAVRVINITNKIVSACPVLSRVTCDKLLTCSISSYNLRRKRSKVDVLGRI